MIKSMKRGKLSISVILVNDRELMRLLFGTVTPIAAQYDYLMGKIDYWCVGDVFEEVEDGFLIPQYGVTVVRDEHGALSISFDKMA